MAERQALKRRGILAAAGAVVAGIAAKQATQPVGATHQPEDLGLGLDNSSSNVTTLTYTGGSLTAGHAALRIGDSGLMPVSGPTAALAGFAISNTPGSGGAVSTGVYGVTTDTAGFGVYGEGLPNGIGVSGKSGNSNGVYGESSSTNAILGNSFAPPGSGRAGVFGYGNGSGTFGVVGDAADSGAGSVGVGGQGAQWGVLGRVNNAPNTIAVYGLNTSTGAAPIGVRGDCTNGIGVYGSTSAAGQYGILGQTLANNSFGLTGIANGSGCAAFAGATTNASSYAAYFQGHVQIEGAFDVIGAGNKHAVVPHPDGSYRTIYSVESPECWVEDFGEGTLAGGKAEIKLDTDFATLVHTDIYHVFVTPHVEQHLHVSQRTASGFVVEASAALAKAAGLSGAGSGTFSWRVVAKPKTSAKVERLAKATLAPKIDFTKLPKPPPPPPVAPTPPRKP